MSGASLSAISASMSPGYSGCEIGISTAARREEEEEEAAVALAEPPLLAWMDR